MKIVEQVSWGSEPSIDEEAGVVRGVKILGLVSSNGRKYRPTALEKAAPLYEGAGVNLDHIDEDKRRVSDGFGRAKNIQLRADGLYGDLEYLKTHPYAAQFVEAAKRMPEQLGLSHSVFGEVKKEGKEEFVEAIHRVRSIDVVRYPATTKGLYESEELGEGVGPRSHFRAAIKSVIDDESLSKEEAGRKIMTILKAEEKVLGKPDGGGETPTDQVTPKLESEVVDDKKIEEANIAKVIESVDKVMGRIDAFEASLKTPFDEAVQRLDVMECCIAHRVNVADVPSADMAKLREQKTRSDMDKIVESWPDAVKFVGKPAMPGESKDEFESIREEMSAVYGFKR